MDVLVAALSSGPGYILVHGDSTVIQLHSDHWYLKYLKFYQNQSKKTKHNDNWPLTWVHAIVRLISLVSCTSITSTNFFCFFFFFFKAGAYPSCHCVRAQLYHV